MITIDIKTLKEIQDKLKPIEMMLDESNQYLKAVKAVSNSGLPDAGLHIVTARRCGFTLFQRAFKESFGYIIVDDLENEEFDRSRIESIKDVFYRSNLTTYLKRKRSAPSKLVLGVKKRYMKAPSIKTCSALEYFKLHFSGTWIT